MLLNLLNGYQPAKGSDLVQSELTNMYMEADTSRGFGYPRQQEIKIKGTDPYLTEPYVAYSFPGLVPFCDTGEANVRKLYEHKGVTYAVAGNKAFSISSLGVATQIGSNLSTSSGYADIDAITGNSDNNSQIAIIDGTNGYAYNIGTSTATFPIADVDFPQTASSLTAFYDYIVVTQNNSINYNISNLSSTIVYDALDFGTKLVRPDGIVAAKVYKDQLWLFGNKTTELWTYDGTQSFPIVKVTDIFLEEGCAARQSVVIAADSLFYLAKSKSGGYGFVVLESYKPKVVSSKPIMYQFSQLTSVSDCIAYSYAKDGHEFIDLQFPTDLKTFTYDITMDTWLKRESYINSSYTRFLGNCSAFCYGKTLIGDYNSGKIYYMDTNTFTENSVAVRRKFVSSLIDFDGKRGFISKMVMTVQTNVGSNKTFLLEKSIDRGATWTTVGTYTIPTSAATRIYTTSCGSGYSFVFRITTTDNYSLSLLEFQADVSVGI